MGDYWCAETRRKSPLHGGFRGCAMNDEVKAPGTANLPIGRGKESGEAFLPSGIRKEANQEIGGPRGPWHSRGYLPHFDGREATQHVTFHLEDSLPRDVRERMEEEIKSLPVEQRDIERRKRLEAWIDSGQGSCVLREPAVATLIQGALLHFDGLRYRLLAWVVMPNHVHVLLQPIHDWTVAKIVASWKKFTARGICDFRRAGNPGTANLLIGHKLSPVWHQEYWDRFIRNEHHFRQALEYIRQNPVKAGLVARPEEWRWSSAFIAGEVADSKDAGLKDANREIGGPGKEL
jgi:REP element-mobilizing transposase RayT